jgi:hypothetical protein
MLSHAGPRARVLDSCRFHIALPSSLLTSVPTAQLSLLLAPVFIHFCLVYSWLPFISALVMLVWLFVGAVVVIAVAVLLLREDATLPRSIQLEENVPVMEAVFQKWRHQMDDSLAGYRGHCYRVYHFVLALSQHQPLTDSQKEQLALAIAFHDIGIWTDKLPDGRCNIDYIAPSVKRAIEFMEEQKKPDLWRKPVTLMISEHHKITPVADAHASVAQRDSAAQEARLIELVRQADLVDFSLGMVRLGLPRALVRSVRRHWPNAGFHAFLVRLILQRLQSKPWNPLPMMKL